MVNANDPAAIPYVINENGYWYVAYKEKNPYVPYITVSAKGVANGLSTEYNDGYDFGPDSYNPNVAGSYGNPPYSQTFGLQEAIDANPQGGKLVFAEGTYKLTTAANNIITFPEIPYSQSPVVYEFEGEANGMATVANGQATLPGGLGVIIDATGLPAPPSSPGNIFFVPAVSSNFMSVNNIVVIFKNIQIINAINSNYSGFNTFYASSAGFENITVTVNTAADSIDAPTGTAFGIRFPMAFNNNLVYGYNLFVQGYAYGLIAAGNTTLLNIYIQSCTYGILCTANNTGYYQISGSGVSTSTYAVTLDHGNIQECTYSIADLDGTNNEFVLYGIYSNFENSGSPPMTTTYNVYDPNGNLRGWLYYNMDSTSGVDQAALTSGVSFFVVKRLSGPVLPASTTVSPVSGTAVINTYGVPVIYYVPITFNPTSTAAATVTIQIGVPPVNTAPVQVSDSEPAAITAGRTHTYPILVPAGWGILITVVNATIGTTLVMETQ